MDSRELEVNLADPGLLPRHKGPPYAALAHWRDTDPVHWNPPPPGYANPNPAFQMTREYHNSIIFHGLKAMNVEFTPEAVLDHVVPGRCRDAEGGRGVGLV